MTKDCQCVLEAEGSAVEQVWLTSQPCDLWIIAPPWAALSLSTSRSPHSLYFSLCHPLTFFINIIIDYLSPFVWCLFIPSLSVVDYNFIRLSFSLSSIPVWFSFHNFLFLFCCFLLIYSWEIVAVTPCLFPDRSHSVVVINILNWKML